MQRCTPKAIRYTEEFLRKNGVYVITNDKVIANEGSHSHISIQLIEQEIDSKLLREL